MYLLDTHALLWYLNDDPKLPAVVRDTIETAETVYISIASFWEIAIKESIGKLKMPAPITQLMQECEMLGFGILPIKGDHLALLRDLTKLHGDPFDRLLICQAKTEEMTLISLDENIRKYDVPVIWGAFPGNDEKQKAQEA